MGEYAGAIFTKKEDMYKCYELAQLLNPKLSEEDYRAVIDNIVNVSNYTQHVVLYDGKPISMVATQDVLLMKVAPSRAAKVVNIATLPEHRKYVTKFLMEGVQSKFESQGYGSVGLESSKANGRATSFYRKTGFTNEDNNSWRKYLNQESRAFSRL
jgi:ribosomal protein S18 acetylase RimI-like enzyme